MMTPAQNQLVARFREMLEQFMDQQKNPQLAPFHTRYLPPRFSVVFFQRFGPHASEPMVCMYLEGAPAKRRVELIFDEFDLFLTDFRIQFVDDVMSEKREDSAEDYPLDCPSEVIRGLLVRTIYFITRTQERDRNLNELFLLPSE